MSGDNESIDEIIDEAMDAEAEPKAEAEQPEKQSFDVRKMKLGQQTERLLTAGSGMLAKRAGPWWEVTPEEASLFGACVEDWAISFAQEAEVSPGKMLLFVSGIIFIPRAAVHVAMIPKIRAAKAAAQQQQSGQGSEAD